MSQDLFAAFGESEDVASIRAAPTNGQGIVAAPPLDEWPPIVADDDDFGDFEDASVQPLETRQPDPPTISKQPAKAAPQPKKPLPFSPRPANGPEIGKHPFAGKMDLLFSAGDDEYDAGADDLDDLANNPEAAMAYSKRIIAEQEERNARSGTLGSQSGTQSKARSNNETAKRHKDPNVLFDIDDPSDDTEEDDWGDFEESEHTTSKAKQPTKSAVTKLNNLTLDDNSRHSTSNSSAKLPKSRHDATKTTATPSAKTSSQPLVAVSMTDDDEAWDDFDDPAPTPAPAQSLEQRSERQSTTASIPQTQPDHTQTLPPTNIPPPSLLLSIFPSVITAAQSDLFDPLSKLVPKQKQQLIAHPATQQLLLSYVHLGTVLGYIIAGRKLRWKRDQILAQGMRIGPAAAGGGRGGMKLAGVDKTELAKEDREVLDVVRLWRLHVGKLRSALALAQTHAGVRPPGGATRWPTVPEIALQYPVKALKQIEGGMTAPHPCALCGLRREERVQQQGFEVEDVFHEWWLSGIDMHLRCRDFWDANKRRLQSR